MDTVTHRVQPEEIEWMLQQHPFIHDPDQLQVHYGLDSLQMIAAFHEQHCEHLLPLLAWPGIATRWKLFLEWQGSHPCLDGLESAFSEFANHLGRLTTYRAIALTKSEFQQIQALNTILPTGRLKMDAATLTDYVRREGIRNVLDMRMRHISSFPYDPSLSLHDHPEIAVCIAEGYLQPPERSIYRFELYLPIIEIIGWRMCDVNGLQDWFCHRGVWFDPTNPRTERFTLFEIPLLSARCKSIRVFNDFEEVSDYLLPFAEEQGRLRGVMKLV